MKLELTSNQLLTVETFIAKWLDDHPGNNSVSAQRLREVMDTIFGYRTLELANKNKRSE